ncbi:MAG TPA: response regulator transcription factor [Gemmatimonadaceae bacterium]|nr:response regulator transcription factor [Gemmatimonadaceae bacterium]
MTRRRDVENVALPEPVATILVIEDQKDLARGLRANLEVEGYEVAVAHTGEEGLRLARERAPSLVLLDIMLPDIEGFDVLSQMRREGMDAPVLILTARGEELEKVRGFRLGADDYVTKPFGVMELLVRIEAILRRSSGAARGGSAAGATGGVHRIGDIEIDVEDHRIRLGGAPVALTPKAFELLLALVRKEGRVATRVELLRDVWGYSSAVTTRTVDTHIAELRRKLERNPAEPRHILTVWKVGYRLER